MLLKEYLTNIANAIRSKLGTSDKVNAQDFADKVSEVYDKGRNDEWSDFWDIFQDYGKRDVYGEAFKGAVNIASTNYPSPMWNEKTFKPKYDMIPTGARGMFNGGLRVGDVSALFANLGVEISFRNAKDVYLLFSNNSIYTRLPVLDFSSAIYTAYCIADVSQVHTIDKIISSENTVWTSTSFYNLNSLQNVVFEGEIACSITFAKVPKLSVESMKSIISCLVNYLGTDNEAKYTLTFTSACWEVLEASTSPYEDGLTDNETLTWKDYIQTVLGWSVA